MPVEMNRALCEIVLIACEWVFPPLLAVAWLIDHRRAKKARVRNAF